MRNIKPTFPLLVVLLLLRHKQGWKVKGYDDNRTAYATEIYISVRPSVYVWLRIIAHSSNVIVGDKQRHLPTLALVPKQSRGFC